MSYCRNCGAYVPDWAENCPACDTPVKGPAQAKELRVRLPGKAGGAAPRDA